MKVRILLLAPLTMHSDWLFADTLSEALATSKFTFDSRLFYFDRDFSVPSKPNATAFTAGDITKLETGSFYGLQLGAAHYGSYLLGLTDRSAGAGTSLLEIGTNHNLSFLGEAYAKYTYGGSSFQFGRQRLNTPLANDHDLRLLPSSYNAAVFTNTDVDNTLLSIGWIESYTGFGSRLNQFDDIAKEWGGGGLAYGYIENKSLNEIKFRVQYAKALDRANIKVGDYRYADVKWTPPGIFSWGAQFAGNDYQREKNATVIGLLGSADFGKIDVSLVYNRVFGNFFRAIESGPMYSDWQQGYGDYGPSQAFGGYLTYNYSPDLSIKLGRVNVFAKETEVLDDFTESMVDINYKLNKNHRIRIRYSIKDESTRAESIFPLYGDRDDLRLIYYYSFSR